MQATALGSSDAEQPTRSRRDAWLRDELILALDLYTQDGPNPPATKLEELSELLRGLPVESGLAVDPAFRSVASVRRKLGNFKALDPNQTGGLPHIAGGDREVWNEFARSPDRLHRIADAVRAAAAYAGVEAEEVELPLGFLEAEEGRILTRLHVSRERNRRIVAAKKKALMSATGRLACEACGFDFVSAYGERGVGFAECHHRLAVSDLALGQRTRLEDLAIVCANCHRMLHRSRPWLSVEELREIVRSQRGALDRG